MARDELEQAFEALARAEGRSVDELKQELLKSRLQEHNSSAMVGPRASAPLARRGDVEFPGTPVVRSARDDYESPSDAQERWYREEEELVDGVHGWGGQSAGGIFGDGAIATDEYDPLAEMRAERRTATHASAQQAVAVTQLTKAVGELLEQFGAPRPSTNILPGVGRRRLRGRRK